MCILRLATHTGPATFNVGANNHSPAFELPFSFPSSCCLRAFHPLPIPLPSRERGLVQRPLVPKLLLGNAMPCKAPALHEAKRSFLGQYVPKLELGNENTLGNESCPELTNESILPLPLWEGVGGRVRLIPAFHPLPSPLPSRERGLGQRQREWPELVNQKGLCYRYQCLK